VLRQGKYGVTIANPLHAVKLFHDYMLKAEELAIKIAELKKEEKGSGGGIRIVLPSPIVDPLLRPGEPSQPLRLLGQDPSNPLSTEPLFESLTGFARLFWGTGSTSALACEGSAQSGLPVAQMLATEKAPTSQPRRVKGTQGTPSSRN
jgi:hypothetical protein